MEIHSNDLLVMINDYEYRVRIRLTIQQAMLRQFPAIVLTVDSRFPLPKCNLLQQQTAEKQQSSTELSPLNCGIVKFTQFTKKLLKSLHREIKVQFSPV